LDIFMLGSLSWLKTIKRQNDALDDQPPREAPQNDSALPAPRRSAALFAASVPRIGGGAGKSEKDMTNR
jgi:hypothetical protein